jgi:hypothetical protein
MRKSEIKSGKLNNKILMKSKKYKRYMSCIKSINKAKKGEKS